jgi:hypothetical protein
MKERFSWFRKGFKPSGKFFHLQKGHIKSLFVVATSSELSGMLSRAVFRIKIVIVAVYILRQCQKILLCFAWGMLIQKMSNELKTTIIWCLNAFIMCVKEHCFNTSNSTDSCQGIVHWLDQWNGKNNKIQHLRMFVFLFSFLQTTSRQNHSRRPFQQIFRQSIERMECFFLIR